MSLDLYVIKNGQNLRCGYTTGSCAAAAAKAAAIMLKTGKTIRYVSIDTPEGIELKLELVNPVIKKDHASCGIIKDAGDDPDTTDGIEIRAQVSIRKDQKIRIEGGQGIGRIKRKGLFGKIGQAAINPVPRQMIEKEVRKVASHGFNILISAPKGEEIAKKTFNPNIGIEGGISILGTKGIVYPMSDEAYIKSICMEIDKVEADYGRDHIILVPGNYGRKIAKELQVQGPVVKVSNYIGESLLYIYNKGFKSVTLLGHIGKFSKLSIGIFNTHSRICDARLEAFIYYLAFMEADISLLKQVMGALTAEEGLNICIDKGYGQIVALMEKGAEERIKRYIKDEDYKVKVIIYSMERGVDFGNSGRCRSGKS